MRAALGAALSVLVCATVGGPVRADDVPRDARELKLLRLNLDNDAFVDSDGAFTAGLSVQLHSPLFDQWPSAFGRWLSRVPGLGDDGRGGRVVRQAWGATQVVITPEDITIAGLQPKDAPWAGMLGGYMSWSSYDNEKLAALQAYFGCIGSCSHAEEIQKFFHNSLGRGKEPRGWPNQLADALLVNLNYEYRRKLWARAHYDPRGWSHDLSAGAQAGIGSFATYAQAWLEYRFGWDVPQGFTDLADSPALGIALDPVYVDAVSAVRARTWRPHFSVVARVRSLDRFAPLEGGATDNGGFHPGVEAAPGDEQLLLGVHVTKLPLAFHMTYYRFLDDKRFSEAAGGAIDWVSFSFERRFGR